MTELAFFVPDGENGPYFIPEYLKYDGTYTDDSWPASALLMTDAETATYWKQSPPDGKVLGVDENRPAWVDTPPLTPEQLIQIADNDKSAYITYANAIINDNQWSSRLILGRLSDNDKVRFNAWLDYIDEVQNIDTSKAPIKKWPTQPGT